MKPPEPHQSPQQLRSAEAALLAALPPPIRTLAARGVVRRYKPHTVLIQEGDHGDTVFVVLSGNLRIYCSDTTGREITLALYGPGEYVGEMSLDGASRSASVVTESEALCAVVTGQTLLKHLAEDPAFAMELIRRLIRRARLATDSARSLALLGAYARFAKLFDQLAVAQADGTRLIAHPMTHQDIALRVGCSREMISILLKDLVGGGYLRVTKKQYVLLRALPERW